MTVTINTDAGFQHVHKIGAFAFWIVSTQGKIMQCGPLKEVKDTCEAEMKAIGNAFYALLKSSFTNVKTVYVNSDSQGALKHLFGHVHKEKPLTIQIRLIIEEVRAKYKLGNPKTWIIATHVKAHSGKESPRKWVNDWCDKQCRQQLKEMILKQYLK